MAIQSIDLRKIEGKAENIYEAIVAASKRARQINDENRLEFNQLISTIVPTVEDEFEERGNPEQEKFSLQFEKREKPHIRAFKELIDGDLGFRYVDEEK